MPRILATHVGTTLRAFRDSARGNVSILLGFALIPMVGLVGMGIDYGVAQSVKSKLDNAADSAAVAAVATAKAYVANNPSDSNATANAIAAGQNRGTRAFTINTGNLPFAQPPAYTVTLTRSANNLTFTAVVTYNTSTQNHFGQIFGSKYINESGQTTASADVPKYLDFYILVDVSGSMGLASTSAGQTALINATSCQFACHFKGNSTGWTYATNNNIQLRSGAVNSAICSLLTTASNPSVPNQYRVGLYPFVANMATLSPLSTDFTSLNSAATCYPNQTPAPTAFNNLLDTGTTQLSTGGDPSTGTGSGGTHFENIFSQMQATIQSAGGFGDGSAASKPQPFVFLITDGMDNGQYYGTYQSSRWNFPGNPSTYSGYSNAAFNGSSPQVFNSSLCSAIGSAGATVSVLYIPYLPLTPVPKSDGNYAETTAANNAISGIPTALTGCAKTGYFYTANNPSDITAALSNMFQQAIHAAHLSQ